MLRNRNPILTIAKRQLASLRNEKTIVFAIMIQLVVALFSSFLVVGVVAIYDPSGVEQGQVLLIGLSGEASEELESYAPDSVRTLDFGSREAAVESFKNGNLNAVIHTETSEDGQVAATIIAPEEGFLSTLSVVRSQSILEDYEQSERQQRADNSDIEILRADGDTSDAPPFVSFIYTILIPLLIFLPSFISGAIIIDSVIEDRKTGMLEILRTTPITDKQLIYGKLAVPLAIGPLQVIAWLVLLSFNDITVERPLLILGIAVGLTGIAVSTAVMVTRYFNDRGSAQFAYSSVLVLLIGVSTLLPELPTTTIGRLGLGSFDMITVIISVVYLLLGTIGVLVAVKLFEPDAVN